MPHYHDRTLMYRRITEETKKALQRTDWPIKRFWSVVMNGRGYTTILRSLEVYVR